MDPELFYTIETKVKKILGFKSSFTNLGYRPSYFEEEEFPSEPETKKSWTLSGLSKRSLDVFDHYGRMLYMKVGSMVNMRNKKVLEIGSGKGAGTHCIYKEYEPNSITGMDLTPKHVETAQALYAEEGIEFVQGDACEISTEYENKYDIVLNVESSHCYPDFERFIQEVKKVLKSKGEFVMCDFREKHKIPWIIESLERNGFEITRKEDWGYNVGASAERWKFPKRFCGIFATLFFMLRIPHIFSYKSDYINSLDESTNALVYPWELYNFSKAYFGKSPIWHLLKKDKCSYVAIVATIKK